MDAIKRGSLLPYSPLVSSKDSVLMRKFAELNVLPTSGLAPRRRDVWKYPYRLSTTTVKLSSSTDVPRKGKKPVRRESKEPRRTVITPGSSDSKEHDAHVVTLEKLATKKAPKETTPYGKRRGDVVWEELRKLTEGDTGPLRWLCYTSAVKQEENAPLFLCLPGMCFGNCLSFERDSSLLVGEPNALINVLCVHLADIISNGLSLSRHHEKLAR